MNRHLLTRDVNNLAAMLWQRKQTPAISQARSWEGNALISMNTSRPIKVVHVYKDFDVFNGLIETFLFLAKYYNRSRIDFFMCVFNYAGGEYGKRFEGLGGRIVNLNCGRGIPGY